MRHRFSIYMKRSLAALYFFWFLLQLGFLFYSNESEDNNLFWPFIPEEESMRNTYGLTEFLVYTGVPLVVALVISLFTAKKYEEETERPQNNHRHETYLGALLREKLRAEELQQELNTLRNQPVSHEKIKELKADLEKFNSHGINQWLVNAELKKKYKEDLDTHT